MASVLHRSLGDRLCLAGGGDMLAHRQAEVEPGSAVIAVESETTSSFDAVSFILARSPEVQRTRPAAPANG